MNRPCVWLALNFAGLDAQNHVIDLQGLAPGLYWVEVQGSRVGRLKLLVR